jgi:hypothetical protein
MIAWLSYKISRRTMVCYWELFMEVNEEANTICFKEYHRRLKEWGKGHEKLLSV